MAMAPLMSAVNHSIATGAVRSNLRAGIDWESARTSDDLATDAWQSEVDDFIAGIATDDDCRAFLRFLVRIADEYVTCLAEVSGDPKEAATRLLARKGVHLTRLLARMSQEEMTELIAALGELLTVLPDRLKLARLGAIFGAAAAVGLIANDRLTAGTGSRHVQRKWYELFMTESAITLRPLQTTAQPHDNARGRHSPQRGDRSSSEMHRT